MEGWAFQEKTPLNGVVLSLIEIFNFDQGFWSICILAFRQKSYNSPTTK